MSKEKITILFVGKNQKAVKPKQVSGRLIANWKKYTAVFILIIGSLVVILSHMYTLRVQQQDTELSLRNKIKDLHRSFAEVDTAAIKEKFTNIDKELESINHYLKARGIKTQLKAAEGGPESDAIISAEETGTFYENYIRKIENNLSYTPLGYPYYGHITSTFGHRENPFNGRGVETHQGLDIRAPMGAPVKSMAKGKVIFAGRRGGYGNCIVLRHGNGFETLYGHLSRILVHSGQNIDIGQKIGKVGSTGRSTGPHLHYEVHRYGKRINPQSFLTLK